MEQTAISRLNMTTPTKVRCKDLKVGDIFNKFLADRIVLKIKDGLIYYGGVDSHKPGTIGANSMEWVTLVGKYVETKKVYRVVVTTLDGDFVGEYNSQKECYLALNLPRTYITKWFNGELKNKKTHPYYFERTLQRRSS